MNWKTNAKLVVYYMPMPAKECYLWQLPLLGRSQNFKGLFLSLSLLKFSFYQDLDLVHLFLSSNSVYFYDELTCTKTVQYVPAHLMCYLLGNRLLKITGGKVQTRKWVKLMFSSKSCMLVPWDSSTIHPTFSGECFRGNQVFRFNQLMSHLFLCYTHCLYLYLFSHNCSWPSSSHSHNTQTESWPSLVLLALTCRNRL